MTSLRPDAIDRLGFGVDELRKHNPKLIYVRGNGLGFKGKEANRPGFDASCFWARGGFADILRPSSELHRSSLALHLVITMAQPNIALAMVMATALFPRERTGKPSVIDVSLLSTVAWMLSADLMLSSMPNYDRNNRAAYLAKQPLMRTYLCADGRWIQLMFLDPARYWPDLCRYIGRPDLIDHPRFATVALRAENGIECYNLLTEAFAAKSAIEWRNVFEGWDAPWEFIQSIDEVYRDPQARANGLFFEVEVGDSTKVELVAGPIAIDGSAKPVNPRRVLLKGEHTTELFGGLGLEEEALGRLQDEGVIT